MQLLTADYTRDDLATVLVQSLRYTGFALLANAPFDQAALSRLYKEWAAFFAGRAKYDCLCDPDRPEGYFPFRSRDGELLDLKECFYFYPGGHCPQELQETTEIVYRALFAIAEVVLRRIGFCDDAEVAATLQSEFAGKRRGGVLRILHYPALSQLDELRDRLSGSEGDSVRLGAHQDLNLLTVLPAATMAGLDVMDKRGMWHRVVCDSSTIVVNAGDELQRISRGYYRSTKHQVRNKISELGQPRYASALFLA